MSKAQRHILTSFMYAIYNYAKNHIIVGNTFEKNCLAMQGKLFFFPFLFFKSK